MYEISRGMKPGVALTATQRKSSLFQEEPTVLGRVLRRGGPSVQIEDSIYVANKVQLERLVAAGSITIKHLYSDSDSAAITVPTEPEVPVVPVVDTPNTITVDELVVVAEAAPVVDPPATEVAAVETAPVAVPEVAQPEVVAEPVVEAPVESKKSSRKKGNNP